MNEYFTKCLKKFFTNVNGEFATNNRCLGIGEVYKCVYFNDEDLEKEHPLFITIRGNNSYQLKRSLFEELRKHKNDVFFIDHKDEIISMCRALNDQETKEKILFSQQHARFRTFVKYDLYVSGKFFKSFTNKKEAESCKVAFDYKDKHYRTDDVFDLSDNRIEKSAWLFMEFADKDTFVPNEKQKAYLKGWNDRKREEMKDYYDVRKGKMSKSEFYERQNNRNQGISNKIVVANKEKKDDLCKN